MTKFFASNCEKFYCHPHRRRQAMPYGSLAIINVRTKESDFLEVYNLIDEVDLVDYISQYVQLSEENGEFWGLSPFKEENTPSFSVRRETNRWYDFSSGKGGNIITFVKEYHKVGYYKALDIIKKYANITDDITQSNIRLGCVSIAKRFKQSQIKQKTSKSPILRDDYMDRYEFNTDKLTSWINEGISTDTLKFFDVRYDRFSNRIVFPIKSYNGDIINVCGRTLDKNYKEKKLRKYSYFFSLGVLDTLYGISENIDEIKKQKEVIVFEGAKSVMLAHQWGIKNTCALLTSHLNPQQLNFLIKLGVRVVFALDEDIDIRQDTNIKKLKRYVTVEWVRNKDNLLGEKMSPVDAGYDIWKNLYDRRQKLN